MKNKIISSIKKIDAAIDNIVQKMLDDKIPAIYFSLADDSLRVLQKSSSFLKDENFDENIKFTLIKKLNLKSYLKVIENY